MDTNYRSENSLLSALNAFFESPSFKGKMGAGIDYIKVKCGNPGLTSIIEKDGKYQPFVIWQGEQGENNEKFEPKVKRAVIAEIKRLLGSGKFFPKDIAILLDTNNNCLAYKNALAKESIYAIVKGDSVFAGSAAEFMRILLNAVCYSSSVKYIRALLTHSFCGFEPADIEGVFMEWMNAVYDAKTTWERYGVLCAIDGFMTDRRLWGRIASRTGGERNITDIRQIMELLNQEEINYGKIPEKINSRFAALCGEANGGEGTEEKLETDDDALKIMTIHKSKGLQFDIVFVPDVGKKPRNHTFPHAYMYHEGNREVIGYFEKNDAAKELSVKEENEENARLLYVALTRAKYRLYAAFNPCYSRSKNNLRDIFDNFCRSNTCPGIQIIKLNTLSEETYDYNRQTETEEVRNPPKVFDRRITPAWQKTSFTGISQNLEHKTPVYVPQKTEPLIPAGKRMGTLLHSIFENLDFNADEEEIKTMVESKLGGFNEFADSPEGVTRKQWVEAQVKTILNKELEGGAGKLGEIKAGNRITELNFLMSTNNINLIKIKEIMGGSIYAFEDEELPAQYLNGAMDLVFLGRDDKYYILDWKSNNLPGYSKTEMEEAMLSHGYHLQYYIYAAALKRWLEQTKKEFDFKRGFGGVFYIFIRGVNNVENNHEGIYFVKGADIADNIAELDKSFSGEEQ